MQLSAATGARWEELPVPIGKRDLASAGQGTMVYSDELLAVAKRIFCFGTPEEALEFSNTLSDLCYDLRLG
jgi:hypothetical protein